MKAYDYDAVTYDGAVYCVDCLPDGVSVNSDDVYPVFADSEWDSVPVCDACGAEHDYVSVLSSEDDTDDDDDNDTPTFRCDQCQALMINGVFCHETGCPNARKTWDADREEWVKYVQCHHCERDVEEGEPCDCQMPDNDDSFDSEEN